MKIVVTSGCFDVLHYGHIKFLQRAKRLGDKLIVLLNSDESVRKLKGPSRPINTQKVRAYNLRQLRSVDEVIYFDDKDPSEALRELQTEHQITYYVKSSNYVGMLPEKDVVTECGGQVVYLEHIKGFSSTEILKNMQENAA